MLLRGELTTFRGKLRHGAADYNAVWQRSDMVVMLLAQGSAM
jgi:hypothetical protein